MVPPGVHDRKRGRTFLPTEDDDSHHSEDDHFHPCLDDHPPRPCQAERKRELERNRRNLVSTRFIQLEKELRFSAPRVHSSPCLNGAPHTETLSVPSKGKRIDKEAVLKEATNRLAVQRRDLEAASARMASMSMEIDNLRAEKVELRSDKTYLRDELETVRKEVQRLREDNINLWQAFRRAFAFKDSFNSDVAKLPAELFVPRVNAQQSAPALSIGDAMVQHNLAMPMSQLLSSQSLLQVPPLSGSLPQAQVLTQSQQQPNDIEIPGVQNVSEQAHVASRQDTISALNNSLLPCMAADDIGDVVSHYVPGLFQNLGPMTKQDEIAMDESENLKMSRNLSPMPEFLSNDPTKTSLQSIQSNIGELGISYNNQALSKSESEDADPFSDVAYCV